MHRAKGDRLVRASVLPAVGDLAYGTGHNTIIGESKGSDETPPIVKTRAQATAMHETTNVLLFRDNYLHEHEQQLSDYIIKKYFDSNICISGIIYFFFILTLKSS